MSIGLNLELPEPYEDMFEEMIKVLKCPMNELAEAYIVEGLKNSYNRFKGKVKLKMVCKHAEQKDVWDDNLGAFQNRKLCVHTEKLCQSDSKEQCSKFEPVEEAAEEKPEEQPKEEEPKEEPKPEEPKEEPVEVKL